MLLVDDHLEIMSVLRFDVADVATVPIAHRRAAHRDVQVATERVAEAAVKIQPVGIARHGQTRLVHGDLALQSKECLLFQPDAVDVERQQASSARGAVEVLTSCSTTTCCPCPGGVTPVARNTEAQLDSRSAVLMAPEIMMRRPSS
jgi:hypothetical protein